MSTGVKTHRITDPNDGTRFVDVDPYVVEGVSTCRWFYNQPSSSAGYTINTSSITDNATGEFTVNFVNSYSDATEINLSGVADRNFSGQGIVGFDTNAGPNTTDIALVTQNTSGSLEDGKSFGTLYGLLA
jgi:hypothetical protein